MSIDLRMKPYATMFEKERPESRIIDELCFPNPDKLFGYLGLNWYDYAVNPFSGCLHHYAAFENPRGGSSRSRFHWKLSDDARAVLIDKRAKLITLLRLYRQWYEHPERVPTHRNFYKNSWTANRGIAEATEHATGAENRERRNRWVRQGAVSKGAGGGVPSLFPRARNTFL
jgi:hypothetical protein